MHHSGSTLAKDNLLQSVHRSGSHLAKGDLLHSMHQHAHCAPLWVTRRRRRTSTQYPPTRTLCTAPSRFSQKTHSYTVCTNTHTVRHSGSLLVKGDLIHSIHLHAHCASLHVTYRKRQSSTHYAPTHTLCVTPGSFSQKTIFYTV